jgi:adenylate kinase
MYRENKQTFKQFMSESTADAGILKAVFVVGVPGAGKTYTLNKLSGAISPKIVNTDRAVEYVSQKHQVQVNNSNYPAFKDNVQRITQKTLASYLNGLLPLFIDSTSNDASNILSRVGILESLGYDVGMIFIDTDLDTAINRAANRPENLKREVDQDFIKKVHAQAHQNKAYFASKFSFFISI